MVRGTRTQSGPIRQPGQVGAPRLMPFGAFINVLPPAVFLVIHAALAVLGLMLWRKAKGAG